MLKMCFLEVSECAVISSFYSRIEDHEQTSHPLRVTTFRDARLTFWNSRRLPWAVTVVESPFYCIIYLLTIVDALSDAVLFKFL